LLVLTPPNEWIFSAPASSPGTPAIAPIAAGYIAPDEVGNGHSEGYAWAELQGEMPENGSGM
jgi:hypothetical protein